MQSSVKLLQLSVRLWQSSVRLLQSTTRLLQSSVRLFQSSLLFSIPFSQSVRVCQSGINQYVNLTQEKDHEWFKKIKGQSGIGSQFTSPFSIRVKRCFISNNNLGYVRLNGSYNILKSINFQVAGIPSLCKEKNMNMKSMSYTGKVL